MDQAISNQPHSPGQNCLTLTNIREHNILYYINDSTLLLFERLTVVI